MKKLKYFLFNLFFILIISSSAFCANEWQKGTGEDVILGTESPADIDSVSFENIVDPLDRLLSNYREGADLSYASSSSVSVSAGEIVCSNSAGSIRKFRKNTSSTTVTWSEIDIDSEANDETYYVYAVGDADATTFTCIISLSSTSPTGVTYYKKLGSFYNNDSGNIEDVISDKLTYSSTSKNPDYDSDWFTANVNTLYTKAHGETLTFPTDILDIIIFWRSGSGGSYIVPITTPMDDGSATGHFTNLSYDGTNIYIYGNTYFQRYRDSGGSGQVCSNGELRILAWKFE